MLFFALDSAGKCTFNGIRSDGITAKESSDFFFVILVTFLPEGGPGPPSTLLQQCH